VVLSKIPVTAIVTAHDRVEQTLSTLEVIQTCDPSPAEIVVHVDGTNPLLIKAIKKDFPNVRLIVSETSVGPGGGRNKLIEAATNEFVASFDDDSYPIDSDYFARALRVFEKFPEAAVVCAGVSGRGDGGVADLCDWVAREWDRQRADRKVQSTKYEV